MCLMPSYTASFNREQQSYEASRIITPTRCEKMSVKKLIYLKSKPLAVVGYPTLTTIRIIYSPFISDLALNQQQVQN